MKKGCFISVIVILTILLLIVFYLFKFHGDEILELGKNKIVELAETKFYDDIDNLSENKYSDSLKIVLQNYFNSIDSLDIKEEMNKIDELSDGLNAIFNDSKIDSAEFEFITKVLTKYERRKEN
jgi:hypothetical protein